MVRLDSRGYALAAWDGIALLNAAGSVWNLYYRVWGYDEIAHGRRRAGPA